MIVVFSSSYLFFVLNCKIYILQRILSISVSTFYARGSELRTFRVSNLTLCRPLVCSQFRTLSILEVVSLRITYNWFYSITACNKTQYGLNCSSTCTCSMNNTVDCDDKTGKCSCLTGWTNTNCDEDINECLSNSTCPQINEECVNLNGSYKCICDDGFERSIFNNRCQGKCYKIIHL